MLFDVEGDTSHRVIAALDLGETRYELECSCGWRSSSCASALDLFDLWSGHVWSARG